MNFDTFVTLFKEDDDKDRKSFYKKILSVKEEGNLTWDEVCKIYNKANNTSLSTTALRSRMQRALKPGACVEESGLRELLHVVKTERAKLADERTQNNAIIRRISREDTLKDIAAMVAKQCSSYRHIDFNEPILKGKDKAAILQISDWHYGIDVDNFHNKYNPTVCKERVQKLTVQVINYLKQQNISNLYIANLQDLIAGRIHLQLRINSQFDVITQIIEVSQILADMIEELSRYCHVDYYDCDDNHSRVEPAKSDSLDLETLTRITRWFLKEHFKDNNNIVIHDNIYGQDILSFNIFEHIIAGVHGDKDAPQRVVHNIETIMKKNIDMALIAHRHHFFFEEAYGCMVAGNGSLMGVDEYAHDLRLISEPTQNLIVVTPDNVCEQIYRIQVK